MSSGRGEPRGEVLAPAGVLRVGLFPSFFYRRQSGGTLEGVAIDIAGALAERGGWQLSLCEYPGPPDVVRALRAGTCEMAFLGLDPARAAEVDFSPPFMQADFSFLVPAGVPIAAIAEIDRPELRIAVVRNHAMDAVLRGQLPQAERVYADTPDAAFELLRGGHATVLAGIRPGLLHYAGKLPGSRVLADRYGANVLAVAVAKGHPARLAFVSDAVCSGLVRAAVANADLRGIDMIV